MIYEIDTDLEFSVITEKEFQIYKNDEIVAPSYVYSRSARLNVSTGDVIELVTDGKFTVTQKPISSGRFESPYGEKLLEAIPENHINMYDRMRAEMLGYLSQMAEKKGLDTYDDDEDDYYADEDVDNPLTPSEYVVMRDEFLKENSSQHGEAVPNLEDFPTGDPEPALSGGGTQ